MRRFLSTLTLLVLVSTGVGLSQGQFSGGGGISITNAGSFGGSPSSLYTISISGTTVKALNNVTGVVDYSGTDAAVILNSIFAAKASTCGTIYFKNGDYPLNSVTLESSATTILQSGSLYYALAIPANAGSTNQYCQWHFEGEQASYASGTALQAQGVIFDVTSTAITAAGASTNMVVAAWARPDTTNNIGNDAFFKNITIRFPNNTRGNEAAFCPYEAGTVDYENDIATLATNPGPPATPNISPAVAGTNRMIGFCSTKNAHNNWQHFKELWTIGYDIGYDIESEHGVLDSVNGLFLNDMAYYGRLGSSTIVHPGVWLKVTDQENINGVVLGGGMAPGSEFDIFGYDIELANGSSNASFVRSTNLTETNVGYTSGIITYQVVLEGSSVQNTPSLWNTGGTNFQMSQGDMRVNYQNAVMLDNFAGPSGVKLNPGWVACTAAGSGCVNGSNPFLAINSGTATPNLGTNVDVASAFEGQTWNNDQFSLAKVSGINAADAVGVLVRVPSGSSGFPTTRSFYKYVCSTSGGLITNRSIYKIINNTATQLVQTAAASGCGVGDTIELDAIGSTLRAYYTASGGSRILDLTASDTSIAGGFPGIAVESNVANRTSLQNWVGGNIASTISGNSGPPSIATSQDVVGAQYATLSNCAAIGSAASPSVAACGSAAAGHFSCATNATGATCQVNTTAVTANSEIFVQESDSTTTGTLLGVTCNSSTAVVPTSRFLSTWVAGTSFTINLGTVTTNPACFEYHIVN